MADNLLRRGAAWLGFVTDNRFDDEPADLELTEQVEQRGYDEPSRDERTSSASNVTALDARRRVPAQPQPATADLSVIITVHPRTFNEARTIGEHFRDGNPVIMNLTGMEDVDAKRLVDFAAGLIFGLRGTFERVTNKVFLLSPPNVTVTAEDKQRIAAGEFYNQS